MLKLICFASIKAARSATSDWTARTKVAEDRLHLYSYFIFQLQFFVSKLNRSKQYVLDQPSDKTESEIQETLKKIEGIFDTIDCIVQDKLYLLTLKIFENWLELKKLNTDINRDSKRIEELANELIKLLKVEYQAYVLHQYKKVLKRVQDT